MTWVATNDIYLDTVVTNLRGYYSDAQDWNGWAIVALPRESVDRLIAALAVDDIWEADQLSWDGDTLVLHNRMWAEENPDYEDERIEPVIINGEPTWDPGSYSWVWSVES